MSRNLTSKFVCSPATAPENTDVHNQALDILIALSMDARTDYLQDMTNKALTKLLGDSDSEARQLREHLFVLHRTYNLIIEYTSDVQEPVGYVTMIDPFSSLNVVAITAQRNNLLQRSHDFLMIFLVLPLMKKS